MSMQGSRQSHAIEILIVEIASLRSIDEKPLLEVNTILRLSKYSILKLPILRTYC